MGCVEAFFCSGGRVGRKFWESARVSSAIRRICRGERVGDGVLAIGAA